MLDKYFQRPIVWDYALSVILCAIIFLLYRINWIVLPQDQYIWSMSSDLSTIALTLSGFILTLLTVLITFKSGSKIKKDTDAEEDNTVFELFFATDLYFETVKHLKTCIKSLMFISFLGYSLKLLLNPSSHIYLYFFNVLGLVVIALTLWRSLLILTKIIALQKQH